MPSAGELRHDLLDEQRERRHPPVAQPANRAIDLPQAVRVSTCWRGVASALLQYLDHDLFFEQWRPPPTLFAGLNLRGLPQHGIGRSCKVGKEQIVALLIALGLFVGEDIGERNRRCLARLKDMEAHLEPEIARGVRIEESANGAEPCLVLEVASRPHGPSAFDLVIALQDGSPAVHVDPSFVDDGRVVVRALCLKEGDAPVIAPRVNEVLARARTPE